MIVKAIIAAIVTVSALEVQVFQIVQCIQWGNSISHWWSRKKLNQCILKHKDKLLDLGVYENIAKAQAVSGEGLVFLLDFLVDMVVLQSCCEFQHGQLKAALMFAGKHSPVVLHTIEYFELC